MAADGDFDDRNTNTNTDAGDMQCHRTAVLGSAMLMPVRDGDGSISAETKKGPT